MKRKCILKNWKIEGASGYYYLVGDVIGHDKFKDMSRVHTSTLVTIDFEDGIAETLNSIYELK